MELVYQAPAEVAGWFRYLIGGILLLTLIPAFILLSIDITAALIFFTVTVFDALLFWAITPRRFEIYSNGLRIKLGGPFGFFTPLENIKGVRKADGSSALAYHGIKFTTSTRGVLEINRYKGLDIVITPSDPEQFLEQFEQVFQHRPAGSHSREPMVSSY